MPHKTKATKNTKKGKVVKKHAPLAAPVHLDMDWMSGGKEEEEASVKSLISNMSSMLMALMARVDGMDGGPGRRTVAFQEAPLPPSWLPPWMRQKPP